MPGFLKAHSETIYALLRIVVGFTFLCHGLQKLGMFGGMPAGVEMNPLLYSAAAIELVGGAMIMIGLRAGWAAFICSGTMAVAYWQFHVFMSQVPGIGRFLPGPNQGIPAALLCFVFLYIACKGAGPWSIDAKREAAAAGS